MYINKYNSKIISEKEYLRRRYNRYRIYLLNYFFNDIDEQLDCKAMDYAKYCKNIKNEEWIPIED